MDMWHERLQWTIHHRLKEVSIQQGQVDAESVRVLKFSITVMRGIFCHCIAALEISIRPGLCSGHFTHVASRWILTFTSCKQSYRTAFQPALNCLITFYPLFQIKSNKSAALILWLHYYYFYTVPPLHFSTSIFSPIVCAIFFLSLLSFSVSLFLYLDAFGSGAALSWYLVTRPHQPGEYLLFLSGFSLIYLCILVYKNEPYSARGLFLILCYSNVAWNTG